MQKGDFMITFIAFILTILGCVNWLLIGLLQYDFVAGLFGFQGSLFSRLIYILIGVGAFYFVIRVIANKGNVKVYEKRKKKEKQPLPQPATVNVEAAKEQPSQNPNIHFENLRELSKSENSYDEENSKIDDGLFDEYTKNLK